MAITDNAIIKDYKDRKLAGKSFTADKKSRMVIDHKLGRIRWFDENNELIGEFGVLEGLNRAGMRVLDANLDNRFFLGQDDEFKGYKLSKPGEDVFVTKDQGLLASSDVIFTQLFFGNFMGGINATNQIVSSFVSYIVNQWNFVIRLAFYKPSDFIVTRASLRRRYFDSQAVPSPTQRRLAGVNAFLNPSQSIQAITGGGNYLRFSSDIVLVNNETPSSDGAEFSSDLDIDQITNINDGWNEIVFQKESSGGNNMGYIQVNLVLEGYKNLA